MQLQHHPNAYSFLCFHYHNLWSLHIEKLDRAIAPVQTLITAIG